MKTTILTGKISWADLCCLSRIFCNIGEEEEGELHDGVVWMADHSMGDREISIRESPEDEEFAMTLAAEMDRIGISDLDPIDDPYFGGDWAPYLRPEILRARWGSASERGSLEATPQGAEGGFVLVYKGSGPCESKYLEAFLITVSSVEGGEIALRGHSLDEWLKKNLTEENIPVIKKNGIVDQLRGLVREAGTASP